MKIAVITGSRAEYGLLEPLIKELYKDKTIECQIIVTGSHLSSEHGNTINDIQYPIDEKIEMVLASDSQQAVLKGMALELIGIGGSYERLRPDMVVLLGDRYEILIAAIAAHVYRVPIAHIHGGEVTEGATDNAFRHSITKMSHLHFVAHEEYRKRVIQLGESPDTVYVTGALGHEGINRNSIRRSGYFVVILHPETLGDLDVSGIVSELYTMPENKTYIMPNADPHHEKIKMQILRYSNNSCLSCLPRKEFLDLLEGADAIIGNSSAGITEAPALGIPTINIGHRQDGRLKAESVIDCEASAKGVREAIEKLRSPEFQAVMASEFVSHYKGGPGVAQRIVSIMKDKLPEISMRKGFYKG